MVSHDRAFGVDSTLKADLVGEVAELPGKVELISDFGRWLLAHLPWPETDLANAVLESRDQEFGELLMQSDFQSGLVPGMHDLAFRRPPYWVDVHEVVADGSVERASVMVGPGGETLIRYDLGNTVSFEAEFPEGAPIEDSWNLLHSPIPGRVAVRGKMPTTVRVGVLFDRDGWSVDDLEWLRSDRTGGATKEPRTIQPTLFPSDGP